MFNSKGKYDYCLISPSIFLELQRSRHFEKITRAQKSGEIFNRHKLDVEHLWENAQKLAEERISKETEMSKKIKKVIKEDVPYTTDIETLESLGKLTKKTKALLENEKKIQKSGFDIESPLLETFIANNQLDISSKPSTILDIDTVLRVFGKRGIAYNKNVTSSLRKICKDFNIAIV